MVTAPGEPAGFVVCESDTVVCPSAARFCNAGPAIIAVPAAATASVRSTIRVLDFISNPSQKFGRVCNRTCCDPRAARAPETVGGGCAPPLQVAASPGPPPDRLEAAQASRADPGARKCYRVTTP